MTTNNKVPYGKPDAGKPHVRFDEGEVASAKPRRGSLLYTTDSSGMYGNPEVVSAKSRCDALLGKTAFVNRLIVFAAAACVACGALALNSASYKQTGLIAQWDAIENAGRGLHDASATTWVDLTGNGHDFNLSNYIGSQLQDPCWSDTSLKAKSVWQIPAASPASDYVTIEICAKHNNAYQCLFNSGDGLKKFVAVWNSTVQFYNAASQNYTIGDSVYIQAAAVHSPTESAPVVYAFGSPAVYNKSDTWGVNSSTTCLGRGANNYQFTGEYYAIRLYDHALTPEEIARHRLIDGIRFLGESVPDDQLVVSGTPVEFSAADIPVYGMTDGHSENELISLTAPAAVTNGDVAATCTGWVRYSYDSENGDYVPVATNSAANKLDASFTFGNSGAEVEWQWSVEYKVTASAAAGGSVSKSEEWVAANGDFTVTATPSAGSGFYRWRDANGNTVSRNATISLNVTEPIAITAEFGGVLYVGTENGDYATIEAALADATEGDEIVLRAGTHNAAAEYIISSPLTIRGITGRPEDVIVQATGTHRLFTLGNADAMLSGFTLSGGTRTGTSDVGAGVYINAAGGIVEKCVVRNCSSNGSFAYGAGICVAANSPGLVDSCVITNCGGQGNGHFHGGLALALDGGEARNCLITGNSLVISFDSGNGYDCGAVRVNGGRLVNCTVTGNTCSRCPGVVATKGTVENCIIVENVRTDATDAKLVTWSGTASCFSNCVGTDAMNETCFVETHPFVNSATGNYAPLLGGAAVDSGVRKDWMVESAKDILGNTRVSGSAPDIGAVEYDQSVFSASVIPDVTFGKAPLDVTFSVASAGASGAITCSWDWDGDGVVDETTGNMTVSHRFVNPGAYGVRLTVSDSGTSYTVPQAVMVTAFGDEIRVVKDNPNAAIPYDTWANAAATLADAYAFAENGCEIVVSNGTYAIPAEIVVIKGVTIRSLTGDPADVVLQASGNHRMFTLGDRNAKFSGLTIAGGRLDSFYEFGGGIRIVEAGGTVERCVISNCSCNASYTYGGGISIMPNSPALVDSCVIRNCGSTTAYFSGGLAMRLDGGEARNCLILDNSMTVAFNSGINHDGGSVYVNGGKLVNCTVTDNFCTRCPGVVTVKGTVENCIIAENTSSAATDAKTISWSGTASCFTNCVASDAMNEWCFAELHPFVNFADGDYAPALGTVAVDACVRKDWMTADAKDVLGNARVSGSAPDIGAIEYDQSKFSVSFSADVLSGKAPMEVTFTVSAIGATDGITCYWDWNGDGTVDETTDGTTTHVFQTPTFSVVRLSVKNNATDEVIEVPQTADITAFGDEVRVVAGNPNAAVPYDNWANAAATLADAYEFAEDGCEIVVSNGIHTMSAEINVIKNVTIRGLTGDPDDVILQASGSHRLFTMGNANAKLSGLTIAGGRLDSYYEFGGGVKIAAAGGTVERCVISNCSCNASYTYGGGISIVPNSPALVDSCVIRNCGSTTAYFSGGLAMRLDGGEARNCLIIDNSMTVAFHSGINHDGGSVYVDGGKLVNCTVTDNFCSRCPGVVALKGTVENCIIAENTSSAATDAKTVSWSGTANCFTNCVATDAMNAWCFAEAHPFVNFAAGDYAPALGTAAVDACVRKDWMVAGAKDVIGNDRVSGSAPDVGAIEYDQSKFSASFKANVISGKAPLDVTFAVTAIGATGGITCSWDWDGDGNADETTGGATTHRFSEPGVYNVHLSVKDESEAPELDVPQVAKITVFGERICVVTDNPNAAEPYDNWSNAAASLAVAYDFAEDGCEIVVASGTHALPAEINVVKNVTIRGQTGNPADVVLQASGSHRLFRLGNANAKITGLTIAGGTTPGHYEYGGCVKITSVGGTLEKCVIRDYKCGGSFCAGLGVYIEANSPGLLNACVISNCVSSSSYLNGGQGLALAGGEARNCLITGNSPTGAFNNDCGSVYLTGGRLVNCTVAGNSLSRCPGVVATGGTVLNCIISENTCTAESADAKASTWAGTASCFDHCIGPVAINENCFTGENLFVDSANGDYRLPKTLEKDVPPRDAGVTEEWMRTGTDFFGHKRISNRRPDLGYFEYQLNGFSLIVR